MTNYADIIPETFLNKKNFSISKGIEYSRPSKSMTNVDQWFLSTCKTNIQIAVDLLTLLGGWETRNKNYELVYDMNGHTCIFSKAAYIFTLKKILIPHN